MLFEQLDFIYMPSGDGGHRLAVYQLTRPQAAEHFAGRQDF